MLPEEFDAWLDDSAGAERFVISRPGLDEGVLYLAFMGSKDLAHFDQPSEAQLAFRHVVRSLKRHLQAGMWVSNPASGSKHFYRYLWISEAAGEFARNGGVLRDPATTNVFSVTEPT
jgi:hypothetical protein